MISDPTPEQHHPVVDSTMSMQQLRTAVREAEERMRLLEELHRNAMRQGVHYGFFGGGDGTAGQKPSLLQPGAQLLCSVFGAVASFEELTGVTDWEKPFFLHNIRCRLTSRLTGEPLAEGLGSCNSRERRFMRGDPYAYENTIRKMAMKRALVCATLMLTGATSVYTQDVEDGGILPEEDEPVAPRANPTGVATENQVKAIYAIGKSHLGWANPDVEKDVRIMFGKRPNELSSREASAQISRLQTGLAKGDQPGDKVSAGGR